MSSSRPLLRAEGIQKTYRLGAVPVPVLRGASLTVDRGEFLVVMGGSGSGKTTLLHILGAVDEPDLGTVIFEDFDLFKASRRSRHRFRNRDVGFVFQFYHLLPELNVLENVVIGRMIGTSLWGWQGVRRRARKDAEEMLERVGLRDRARHRPNQLSGGERQRVAIARALINRPKLLLADEPTGNLDAVIGSGILDLLSEFNAQGQAIVMVTHDLSVAARAHRTLTLESGTIHEEEPAAAGRTSLRAVQP